MKRKQKAAVIASVLAIATMTTQVQAEQLTEAMGNTVVSAEAQAVTENVAPAAQTGVLPADTESSQDVTDITKETQKEEGTTEPSGQVTGAEKETEVLETGKEAQKEEQKEEQEAKRWYAISFSDIAMQLLVAMLLIVLPGCWIYYKCQ